MNDDTNQRAREAARIAKVMEEDGGCWTPCSGCQESCDGCVSAKDYPYDARFKCQPGSGCRECGGIGVIWQDGAFLSSWGDALSEEPATSAREEAIREAAEICDQYAAAVREPNSGISYGTALKIQRSILSLITGGGERG
ncbi:hypothetical protein ABIC65_001035 [Sphingomonas trueperi]|uniref:hypothetical protein n=1 Tax=Sphingomonas trueperi TaxID=53317 RepID=UPI0033914016